MTIQEIQIEGLKNEIKYLRELTELSCNICVESYNKTNQVTCKCDFNACRSCIKTYLLDKTEDAHCMYCKVGWDRMFMASNFDDSFACLCGIERKTKAGIRSHIKKVHFGQVKPKVQKSKIEKPKIKKEKLSVNCYNCHKTFTSKYSVLRHIKKQVCANDSDIVMGF